MAKNNKYASINFNHIYEKTTSTNAHNRNPSHSASPSSSSYSAASYSSVSAPNKAHGRILVLTRHAPKPVTPPTPQPQHQPPPNPIHHTRDRSEPPPDAISLRPLGRTGTASPLSSLPVINHDNKDLPSPQPKTDKFVPPHLRPGFVPREETPPGPGSLRPNGRPKSGGGQERMRRGGPDAGIMGHGSRPSSSGWYVVACLFFFIRLFINPFVLRNGYEVEFFSEDKDEHILLQRWLLYTNSVNFVSLELTSIFTRHLKSPKTKTDQVADFQHIMSQLVAKFVVLVEGFDTQVLLLVFGPL
ncbi:hypothetical protein VNO80_27321 [Phaseolus coccineus]|uniref:Uncharacterized protein n=1 Tax=Phaseolus coccineus TaxID=3886 RepID=A0AAN9LL84_PHACN